MRKEDENARALVKARGFLSHFQELGFDILSVNVSKECQKFEHQFDVLRCDFESKPLPFNGFTYRAFPLHLSSTFRCLLNVWL